MQISNLFTANQLPLVSGILNAFNEENWPETLVKVKDFARGFFKGLLAGVIIGLAVVSIPFLIVVGYKGAEKVAEIFSRLSGK